MADDVLELGGDDWLSLVRFVPCLAMNAREYWSQTEAKRQDKPTISTELDDAVINRVQTEFQMSGQTDVQY
jgi:hypothetical protein